jgi:hypothetical protein
MLLIKIGGIVAFLLIELVLFSTYLKASSFKFNLVQDATTPDRCGEFALRDYQKIKSTNTNNHNQY